MLWMALKLNIKLNSVLWVICSALQRSSCVSAALTHDLSNSDTKTVQSCFSHSFK